MNISLIKRHVGFLLFFFLANIFFLLSNYRLIYGIIYPLPSHIFHLQHFDYEHDYDLYLSAITQGAHGKWLYTDAYTTEDTTPGIFYLYYILNGKIAALFHLWPPYAYHLFRVLSVEGYILSLYVLSTRILGSNAGTLGAYLALIGTIAPPFVFKHPYTYHFTSWWIEFDAIERLNGIGHLMFGQFSLIAGVFFAVRFFQSPRIYDAIIAAAVFGIGGIMYPPVIAPPVCALAATTGLMCLRTRKIDRPRITGVILMIAAALTAFLLIRWQEHQGFPWNIWTKWNVDRWNNGEPDFNHDMLLIFGILPFLALPGIITSLRNGAWEKILISFWALTPFLLLPLANILMLPKLRLIQEAPFVPLSIMAAYTITLTKKPLSLLLCFLFLLTTIPVSALLLTDRIMITPDQKLGIPKDAYAAISFLDMHAPVGAKIIGEYSSLSVSALAPVVSYFGHQTLTNDFFAKLDTVRQFFSGAMGQTGAYTFLNTQGISYVFYSPAERQYGDVIPGYPFLQHIYTKDDVRIYQVKRQ